MSQRNSAPDISVSRRQWMAGLGAAAGAVALARTSEAGEQRAARAGRIRHSLVQWCYEPYWSLDEMCQVAKRLGCLSIELVQPEGWPTIKKHGLSCAISPSHLYVQGMNNPRYQPGCLELLEKRIDQAADAGVPTVITFTGYAQESGEWAGGANPDIDKLPSDRRSIEPDQGLSNCVAGFKKIVGHAEKKKINLAIEMLNTRASEHPMTGHPGYQGDHIDYCMEIIKQVGSPRLGLLFDIYHVQIMDGDLIRRVRECGEAIHHVHTAGNPGRHELDENQEINFPPCMKALLDIGYKGYVGHEFIPTRDPLQGLTQAIRLCDV